MEKKRNHRLLCGLSVLLLSFLTACGALAGTDAASGQERVQPASGVSAEAQDEKKRDAVLAESASEENAPEERMPGSSVAETGEAMSSSDDEFLGGLEKEDGKVSEDGSYSQKDEVAEYLHLYGHLPDNYITKREARELGWDSAQGNLWDVAPGKSIGGDHFGNYEGLLPEEDDRDYFECDIDYEGGRRNAKRIIYSDDGLIFYTEDHYASFERLYGD